MSFASGSEVLGEEVKSWVRDHLVRGVKPEQAQIGMRVKAVLKPKNERIGAITDIKHFEPL